LEKLLKVLLLKDQWLIATIEEIDEVTFGDPDCILINPMVIDNGQLKNWIPFSTKNECVVRSSDIITFVDPSSELLALYQKTTPELLIE